MSDTSVIASKAGSVAPSSVTASAARKNAVSRRGRAQAEKDWSAGKSRAPASAVLFLTLKQVSERFHLPVSTLRYYDKEGFFDHLPRTSGGIRLFGTEDLRRLKVIEPKVS